VSRRLIALIIAAAAVAGHAQAQPAADVPAGHATDSPATQVADAPARALRDADAAQVANRSATQVNDAMTQPAPDAPAQPASDAPGPQPADGAAVLAPDAVPAAAPLTRAAPTSTEPADDEIGDQGISGQIGLTGGGRVTPGGLRIAGHYLYQLSERDWFDGTASFTFGSGSAACFRDRADQVVCSHGIADGAGVEVSATVRRVFAPQGAFRPYARVGVGIGLARFADDDVSGFTIPLHGGGGVRVKIAPAIAIVAEADLALGIGSFNRGIGLEPQLGLAVTAGVEFRLR
jgi:opacity protein-like surface antigen